MHIRLRKIRLMRRINRRAGIAKLTRNERGVQLAELAIVLPLLVVMFAATAEFGRYFYAYTTLAKGARIGSTYLATACVKSYEDTNAKNLVVYGNAAGTGPDPARSGCKQNQYCQKRCLGVHDRRCSPTDQTVTGLLHRY